MTYGELLTKLLTLTEDQLDMDVMVYDSEADEFYQAQDLHISPYDDVLDNAQPYLTFGEDA